MVIVKVNGDLIIDEGVTVGPYYTNYGGPKGFLIYVTGTLTNNGTINNNHGANAVGKDVYLWKNPDGTDEVVPAVGASGGSSSQAPGSGAAIGNNGEDGTNRQTGGGASGSAWYDGSRSGPGGKGTGDPARSERRDRGQAGSDRKDNGRLRDQSRVYAL